MKYSELFTRTNKEAKEFDSVNATLLQKAGFIDQTMAGVYSYLPLGQRVLTNIEHIIRKEMNTLGNEVLLPALSPSTLWEQTGRLETIDVLFQVAAANDPSREKNDAKYILNPTHEELITPIAQQHRASYKDLPFAVYQIQTKFRNEARPKSGLLRGREFRMKDLYSFHPSEEDLNAFYEQVKQAYMNIFHALGIGKETIITKASGGDFTTGYSHEFQTLCETGEDTIYIDEKTNEAWNEEVATDEIRSSHRKARASEVGNIFPLGTKFSDAFGYTYLDQDGSAKPVWMGSYGIGSTRVMGILVEKFHDERGIIWPESVAPFRVHLAALGMDDDAIQTHAHKTYEVLSAAGVEVLFDDRQAASPGEKLADADLIGIPWRVVISKKTGDQIEVKNRSESDISLMALDECISRILK